MNKVRVGVGGIKGSGVTENGLFALGKGLVVIVIDRFMGKQRSPQDLASRASSNRSVSRTRTGATTSAGIRGHGTGSALGISTQRQASTRHGHGKDGIVQSGARIHKANGRTRFDAVSSAGVIRSVVAIIVATVGDQHKVCGLGGGEVSHSVGD